MTIPLERLERNPLINEDGYRNFLRIAQHRHAPQWNYLVGDRLRADDLPEIEKFRERVFAARSGFSPSPPPPLFEWIRSMRERSDIFARNIPEGLNLEKDWAGVNTTSREDIATRIEDIVPRDADLSRLIVYDTSGTTGHALIVPHHPQAIAKTHALCEHALTAHGLKPAFRHETMACINICAQVHTVVFPNVFTVWNQAGYAKINLHKKDWNDPGHAERFVSGLAPFLLTGDPVAFAEMVKWGITHKPRALLSTALELAPALKRKLEREKGCPVIDWYSTTETGPIARSCPQNKGLHIGPPDLFVEIIGENGEPLPAGEFGEIAVTGGRNPYLPLLRYRTGDFAALDASPCPCGDPSPRLTRLHGRDLVIFRAADNSPVNPVDIGRVLRDFLFIQHEFIQRSDRSCDLTIRPYPHAPIDLELIRYGIIALFGEIELRIAINNDLGKEGKVVSYKSEMGQ